MTFSHSTRLISPDTPLLSKQLVTARNKPGAAELHLLSSPANVTEHSCFPVTLFIYSDAENWDVSGCPGNLPVLQLHAVLLFPSLQGGKTNHVQSRALSPRCNTQPLSNLRPSRAGCQLRQRLSSVRAAVQGQHAGFLSPQTHAAELGLSVPEQRAGLGQEKAPAQHLTLCPKGTPVNWEHQRP